MDSAVRRIGFRRNVRYVPILLKNSIIWMGDSPGEYQINLNFAC